MNPFVSFCLPLLCRNRAFSGYRIVGVLLIGGILSQTERVRRSVKTWSGGYEVIERVFACCIEAEDEDIMLHLELEARKQAGGYLDLDITARRWE